MAGTQSWAPQNWGKDRVAFLGAGSSEPQEKQIVEEKINQETNRKPGFSLWSRMKSGADIKQRLWAGSGKRIATAGDCKCRKDLLGGFFCMDPWAWWTSKPFPKAGVLLLELCRKLGNPWGKDTYGSPLCGLYTANIQSSLVLCFTWLHSF